jgi:septation ring formation regulator EzrA
MTSEDEQRLNRIETKVDKMTEAMVDLVRAEEKLVQLHESTHILFQKISTMDDRIRSMEKSYSDTNTTVGILSRAFWIVMTGIISAGIGYIFFWESQK